MKTDEPLYGRNADIGFISVFIGSIICSLVYSSMGEYDVVSVAVSAMLFSSLIVIISVKRRLKSPLVVLTRCLIMSISGLVVLLKVNPEIGIVVMAAGVSDATFLTLLSLRHRLLPSP